jgi:hypothetical protein
MSNEVAQAKNENNIYQRINAVRKAIGYVQKDKSVSTGGGSYKAVTHDTVTAITREHMIEHGIVCIPTLIESTFNLPIIGTDGSTAKQRLYEATYDFKFVNVDRPEDVFIVRMQGHAMDNADKAPGKALSYAKKYAVLKVFEIETGEDEESRYKTEEEFPVENHIKLIESCGTLDNLKTVFASSFEAAGKDTTAQKAIILAKNKRGKELTAGESK